MTLLVLFPGEGTLPTATDLAAEPGGGEDGVHLLAEAAIAARLRDVTGFLARGGRALRHAGVMSPLVVALGLMAFARLARRRRLDEIGPVLLGHSLGELTALAASGAIDARDAIHLAAERGRALDDASRDAPGALYAIHAGDAARALGLGRGDVTIALSNAPDEVVVGGPRSSVAAIARQVPGRRLSVGGAFHTRCMRGALSSVGHATRAVRWRAPSLPIFSAATLSPITTAGDAASALLRGVCDPVHFREALRLVRARGAVQAVLIPPARTLRELLRRNLPDVEVVEAM